ncbi:hypothetical protein NQ317_014224 [Molorchus minor]|uniref:Uncharacterized protein n=1 Tax=Molorchus minor TaxID=1323400 RepID=A0ABQ9JZZ8_9CUCU|nr:hypothetical protein NQ317_014224 [Molorchus minor]
MTPVNLFTNSNKFLVRHTLKRLANVSFTDNRQFSATSSRNMRFVQYKLKTGGPQQLGAQISNDGDIFDISAVDSSIPNSLVKFLATGNGIYEKAKSEFHTNITLVRRLIIKKINLFTKEKDIM